MLRGRCHNIVSADLGESALRSLGEVALCGERGPDGAGGAHAQPVLSPDLCGLRNRDFSLELIHGFTTTVSSALRVTDLVRPFHNLVIGPPRFACLNSGEWLSTEVPFSAVFVPRLCRDNDCLLNDCEKQVMLP